MITLANGRLKFLGLIFVIILTFNPAYGSNSTDPDEQHDGTKMSDKHPLDPLSDLEIRLAVKAVLTYNHTFLWDFEFIGLHEPDKALLYPYYISETLPPPGLIPRRADVLIADPSTKVPICVVVNLKELRVESWQEFPNDRVPILDGSGWVTRQDPDVIARLKQKGYNNSTDICTITSDGGYVADNPNYSKVHAGTIVQVVFYDCRDPTKNYYEHALDFVVFVEVGKNVVRGIENYPIRQGFDATDRTGDSVPQKEYKLNPGGKPLNPLKISQPNGPSFKIAGYQISWDNFTFRLGYNQREGPYINTVTYNDHGQIRPVAYRISLSEIFMQYGDPRPPYHRKDSFEMANWEMGGPPMESLPVHQYCRGDAYYFPVVQYDSFGSGETNVLDKAVCVGEEDAGVLWTTFDNPVEGTIATTRAQRLSIIFLSTIGVNYLVSWRFYQDGTIELGIKITGIYNANLMAVDVKAPPYGNLMGPQLYTQIYQHQFAVRIDADVDGMTNTVSTEDIVPVSNKCDPQNPYGNGMTVQSKVLKTVGEAPTDIIPGRVWKISNSGRVNPLSGKPVGWKLIPQGNQNMPNLLTKDSPLRERVPWIDHNVWVTPYNPDQLFVGGRFLSDGVAKWTQQNASTSIVDKDVVLWHVFNYVENPDVDEWPVISGHTGTLGFRLRPTGFFGINPSIEVQLANQTTALDGRENENSTCAGYVGGKPKPPGSAGWSSG